MSEQAELTMLSLWMETRRAHSRMQSSQEARDLLFKEEQRRDHPEAECSARRHWMREVAREKSRIDTAARDVVNAARGLTDLRDLCRSGGSVHLPLPEDDPEDVRAMLEDAHARLAETPASDRAAPSADLPDP